MSFNTCLSSNCLQRFFISIIVYCFFAFLHVTYASGIHVNIKLLAFFIWFIAVSLACILIGLIADGSFFTGALRISFRCFTDYFPAFPYFIAYVFPLYDGLFSACFRCLRQQLGEEYV